MAKTASVPRAGDQAPAFEAQAHTGETIRLEDLRGKPVVLYFYPKDDTPGCTVEAKQFQASVADFQKAGATVLGVSPDDVDSHCKFADKFSLTFPLLADTDHALAEQYGVWVEKNRFGRKYWGVQRATFLIGPDGTIQQAWPKVKPEGHAAEVLSAIGGS